MTSGTQPSDFKEASEVPLPADINKTSRAQSAHISSWDIEYRRPIVDGKIAHPTTGEIIEAGKKSTYGPPMVCVSLFNISENTKMRSLHTWKSGSMERLYLGAAKHVRDGIYKIISVNASEYNFTIVCDIQVSDDEFREAWRRFPATPEQLSSSGL